MSKLLSIIIPWCNRFEIKESLLKNKVFFVRHDLEIIIVNCSGQAEWLDELCRSYALDNIKVIDIRQEVFNKSLAINLGAYKASSRTLFLLDADIIIKDDFIDAALSQLQDDRFICINRVYESGSENGSSDQHAALEEIAYFIEIVANGKKLFVETNRVRFLEGSRSAPGLILLSKNHFIAINGMNSDLQYWGWEDIDMQIRLQAMLNLSMYKLGSVIHISHGDEVRNFRKNSRVESETTNFSICLSRYNISNYHGSYSSDVKRFATYLVEKNF